jgi:hypothetical protein
VGGAPFKISASAFINRHCERSEAIQGRVVGTGFATLAMMEFIPK